MKKFLMALLLLIPVIIVLAVSTAGVIISGSVSVMPASITVKTKDNAPIQSEALVVDISDTEEFIIIDIVPTIVSNSDIEYRIDPIENMTGMVKLERIGNTNRYRIIPIKSGGVRLIISSILDVNIYKAITIWVRTNKIESVGIYNKDGENISQAELIAPEQFYCDIYPIEALKDNLVEWSSNNEGVAKVSKNGLVYPVSQGTAIISVKVTDMRGDTVDAVHFDSVLVDTRNALVNMSDIYTSDKIDAVWLERNVVLDSEASVERLNDNSYLVTRNGFATVVNAEKCELKDKGFLDNLTTVYTRNGPYFLETGYLDFTHRNEKANGVITTDDASVAVIVGNEIIPKKAGVVNITADFGDMTATKQVTVREIPLTFDLTLNNEDAARGIKQDRIWAVNWYDGENTYNAYQFGISNDNGLFDVLWEVDDASLASIDENALITFRPESLGKEIKVTATVMVHNYKSRISRSFTFKISEHDNAVNVSDYDELFRANEERRPMVIQDNIFLMGEILAKNNIYGNGFIMSGEKQNLDQVNLHVCLIGVSDAYTTEDLLFEDFTLQGVDGYENSQQKFTGFRLYETHNKVTLKNLILRYMHQAAYVKSSRDLVIDGCIMGDNYALSMFVSYSPEAAEESVITFKNTILKKSEGPAIMFTVGDFVPDQFNKNLTPTVRIEGFMEIYNWKYPDELKNILSAMDLENNEELRGMGIDPKALTNGLGKLLKDFMTSAENEYLSYYDESGERFFSSGMFFLGVMLKHNPAKVSIEDKSVSIKEISLANPGRDLNLILTLISALGMYAKNNCYFVGLDFSEGRKPAFKPGEPIPQNLELFDRLRNGKNEK